MKIFRMVVLFAAVSAAALTPFFAAPSAAQGAPTVTGVAVTSDAGADATYALGETVRVTVTFSEAVDVTGAPTLAIDMDPAHWGTKRAAYESGGGTTTLVFAHEVVEPNYSTRGVAVLADTLALSGGTIRSAATGADASLAHEGLAHDASHKVDWRRADTTAPRLVRGEVDGGTMRLFFSEALDPNATGGRFNVQVQTSATGATSFHAAGAVTVDGATVTVGLGAGNPRAKAGLLDQNQVFYQRPPAHIGGGLRDLAGNRVSAPHSSGGRLRTRFVKLANLTGPAVTGVALVSDAGLDGTYAHGETVRLAVTFSEAVSVTGAPRLKLDLGAGAVKWAAYESGSGTTMLAFAWTVAAGDVSEAGVAAPANALELNGGAIRAATRDKDADLAHGGLAADPYHKVDGTPDTRAPRLSVASVNGATLKLSFDEPLGAAASPASGAFTVKKKTPGGAGETVGLSGTPAIEGARVTLRLAEAVRETDTDVKVSYRKSALDAGSRLRDEAGNEVTGFSDEPVANVAGDTTPPRLVRGEIDGGTMTLYFSEALDPNSVGGQLQVSVNVWGNSWYKSVFYVDDGLKISGNTVTVRLGNSYLRAKPGLPAAALYMRPADPAAKALRDLAGNPVKTPHGSYSRAGREWLQTRKIGLNNITTGPPISTSGEVSSDAGEDATYGPGDTIRVRLAFNEAVNVTGTPRVKLDFGAGDERWAVYASGSGTKTLEFAYAVAQGDVSKAGVAVPANSLELNGGRIRAVAGGRNGALAHGMLWHDSDHRVDGIPPVLSRANVDGARLALIFDEALGAAASLANGAFTVKKTPQGESEQTVSLTGTPAIDGAVVTLTLTSAVLATDTGVKVSYVKPTSETGNRLRDEVGNEAVGFSDQPVTKGSPDATPPRLVRGEIDGGTMTLYFSEALDPDSVGGYFFVSMVRPSGVRITFHVDARDEVEISGNAVTAGLEEAFGGPVRARAGVTDNFVLYVLKPDLDPNLASLRDLAGNRVSTPIHQGGNLRTRLVYLDNLTGVVPTVTGVAVSSEAGDDDAYLRGETIGVRLTFSKAVAVTGTPRLKLDFSTGARDERWAAYASGSGTTMLEFTYTVAQGDASSAGVAVLANTLALNGGAIRGVTRSEDAALSHAGLAHDPAHKVDAAPPTLSVASVNGATLKLIFDEALGAAASLANGAFMVKKTPQGSSEQTVGLSGTPAINGATVTLTLANAVLETDTDVKVSYVKPTSGTGNRLRDAAGHEAAGFSDEPVTNVTGDTTPPRLVRGEIDGGTMTLYFSEALDPDSVGGQFSMAVHLTVPVQHHFDATGDVEIDGNKVTVGVGEGNPRAQPGLLAFAKYVRPAKSAAKGLRDLAGHPVASTRPIVLDNLTGVAPTPDSGAVGNSGPGGASGNSGPGGAGPPSVTGVSVVSSPASGDAYLLGEKILIRATFSEAVAVTGSPKLAIDMDPAAWGEKQAAYESGGGTKSLTFAHEVVEPNYSTRGIAVLADSLALNGGTIRSAGGADAALGHGGLGHDANHKVDWRPAVSVADARANEGAGATVDFEVSLDRAFTTAAHSVTVDYATADGTATAGEDYTATSGTLTFAAGETQKTVSVPVLDDSHDEGEETFSLRLSNAAGGRIGDGEATGTIVNTDAMPRAWLARFGRAAAEHVAGAIGERLGASPGTRVTLGGQELDFSAERDALTAYGSASLTEGGPLLTGAEGFGLNERTGEDAAASARELSMPDLLLASSFHMASADGGGGAGSGRWSVWGRGARSSFEGAEGALTLEGDVTTATLGFDYERGAWLAGVALSRSSGEGSYEEAGMRGEVESALTGVYPYARYRVSEKLALWGVVGFGAGDMTLEPAGSAASIETDIETGMAAAGARGVLLPARSAGGFELALRADLLAVATSSDAARNLVETEVETSRLRLLIEASRSFRVGDGSALAASVEAGLRYDGGDAETGSGLEAGGSLRWTSGSLAVEIAARGLMAHSEDDYEEWGVSGSVRYAQSPDGRGFSMRAGSAFGAAAGGAERLWSQRPGAPGSGLAPGASLDAEAAYGFGFRGGLLTPYTGVALSDAGDTWRAGARWKLGAATEMSIEANLTEPASGDDPESGLLLKGSRRW